MDTTTITELVGTLGLPTVLSLGLMYYVLTRFEKAMEKNSTVIDRNTEAFGKVIEVINKCGK